MATRRIYLPSSGSPSISPAFDGSWTSTSGADQIAAVLDTPSGSSFATKGTSGSAPVAHTGYLLRQYVTPPICIAYATSTAFTVGEVVDDGTGHLQQCIVPGTTGGSAPTWNHTYGNTTDGGVTWGDCGSTTLSTNPGSGSSLGKTQLGYGVIRGEQTLPTPTPAFSVSQWTSRVYSSSGALKATLQPLNVFPRGPAGGSISSLPVGSLIGREVASASHGSSPSTFTLSVGDVLVIEIGVAFGNGVIGSWAAELEFGDSAGSDLSVNSTTQLNPWVDFAFNLGNGPAPPTPGPPLIPGAWLVVNEPSIGYTDRSSYLHMKGGGHSFNLQLRQRGKATYRLKVLPGDSYTPTQWTPIYLYDVNATGSILVFSGILQSFTETIVGTGGLRFYDCTAVSLEAVFDTVYCQPVQYVNQTCGFIVADLFSRFEGGCPVTLGTIQAGETIPLFNVKIGDKLSEIFTKLATTSLFIWGVDPQTQQLYFQAPNVTAAPFPLTSSQALWNSITVKYDGADQRNRQAVVLSYEAFNPSAEYFVGSGQQSFTLARPVEQVTNAFITLSTPNTATGTFSGTPSPGDTATIGPAAGARQASHIYSLGGVIIVAGYAQKVTTAGTSASGAGPTFSTITGATTTDGSVIWTCQGPAGLSTGTATYTFVTALDNTQFGQVLISGSSTYQHLVDAINANAATRGVTFSLPTWENSQCNAINLSGAAFTLQQKAAGSGWIAGISATGTAFSWSSANTTGGTSPSGSVGPNEGATISIQVYVQGTSTAAPGLAYTPGSAVVTLATPLNSGTNLNIEYTRVDGNVIEVEDTAGVTALAAITHGTGKLQQSTDQSSQGVISTSSAAGLQFAQQIIAAFGVTPEEISVQLFQPGLLPGQQITLALTAPLDVLNADYVVQEISAELVPPGSQRGYLDNAQVPGGGHYRYTARLININQIYDWLGFWQGLNGGAGGSSGLVATSGGSQSSAFQPTLPIQVNSTPASSQSLLNFTAGTNITISDAGAGQIVIASGGGGGGGGVTSVDMSVPSFLIVAGNPITTAGTLAVTLATQTAATVFAGPVSGSAAAPTFRALVAADIPALSAYLQVANNLSELAGTAATARVNLGIGVNQGVQFGYVAAGFSTGAATAQFLSYDQTAPTNTGHIIIFRSAGINYIEDDSGQAISFAAGVVSLTNALAITSGGTGATTKASAFDALSPMSAAGDIVYGGTSGTGTRLAHGTSSQALIGGTTPLWGAVDLSAMVTGTLPIANGGTAATTAGAARTSLGLGTAATHATSDFLQSANDLSELTATASVACANIHALYASNNLSELTTLSVARTNLGLGSAALLASSAVLQVSSNLSDVANAATARVNLGLGSASQFASSAFLQTANNLSDIPNTSIAAGNLGLGTADSPVFTAITSVTGFWSLDHTGFLSLQSDCQCGTVYASQYSVGTVGTHVDGVSKTQSLGGGHSITVASGIVTAVS